MSSTRFLRTISSAATRPRFASPSSQLIRPFANQRLFHSTPANMVVHHVETVEDFNAAIKNNDKVLVDCFATWCGPCKAISPILEKASDDAEFKDSVHFIQIDVDQLPELSQDLGVRAMPTFLFFKDGDKVGDVVGANPPALLNALKQL